ncbi:methylated-DNA--[protein]-cysteine S-methyltransferase [Lapillicoccus jejuensis]|uniref:Methylated-DNA--protein-cysteine methyltransferase n=1 Tax=Lapillicoccus jejuensis TaxID=402171 RepID=A0A542DXP1_9MICO|nr:methylated-DNA--[protein]-cysteine S-methyltransferase [Lapillicoccus jejuensis]TQJ07847.1 methylated-DNA-[protein]-cysteine S-methyltransferase [Lapillicoccus jejuensis]
MTTPPSDLDRLRDRLADAAERDGTLDVAVRTLDSPVGPLLLAATPAGVVRIAFEGEGFDAVEDELARRVSPRVLLAPRRLDPAARWLDAYFAGRRLDAATGVALDRRLSSGYRREVLDRLATDVPYGAVATYGELAARTSSPRAVRAVGTACATNPLPLLVPCHRVVRSDGTPGRYRGGADAKRTLLALEQGALGGPVDARGEVADRPGT